MRFPLTILIICFLSQNLVSQTLFSDSEVSKLDFHFDQTDYWQQLKQNKESGTDIPATLIVNDTETFDSVGVRFKGNSSYNMSNDKKPFNITMDEFIDGQDLWGIETFNLGNAFMDPTMVREKITYDIYRKYMPACEVGYAAVYLNGEYWGLYVLVEQINKDFLRKWFEDEDGNLYKGDPHGALTSYPDMEKLKRDYEKKTNEDEDDWSDLYELTQILNHSNNLEEELPSVLNIDRTLWYLALCNVLTNLDSYINSGHNYYIYKNPKTDRFNMLPWDLNESFGCFPARDFSVDAFVTLSPFYNETRGDRPLLSRLLAVPEYRADYLAHYRVILEQDLHPDTLEPEIRKLQALIEPWLEQDSNKLYSMDFFSRNVTENIVAEGNRTAPGILSLAENRTNFLSLFADINQSVPVLGDIVWTPGILRAGERVSLQVHANDETGIQSVECVYSVGGGIEKSMELNDDGIDGDEAARDAIYGGTLDFTDVGAGSELAYYIKARNKIDQVNFDPPGAAFDRYWNTIQGSSVLPDLVINEFLASNQNTLADPQGDFDDWVEIHNRNLNPIQLEGYFLSDDSDNSTKWAFPDTSIAGQSYLVVWTDSDEEDSLTLHTNFNLSKSGEYIGLYDQAGNLIDGYYFSNQEEDVSMGRIPDGSGDFMAMTSPTPGLVNAGSTHVGVDDYQSPAHFMLQQNYPNPFNGETVIAYQLDEPGFIVLTIHNVRGQSIFSYENVHGTVGSFSVTWDGKNEMGIPVPSGLYVTVLENQGRRQQRKMLLVQ